MRRVFQCNPVFILVISLCFVQGCNNGTDGKAAVPTVTPGDSSGKQNTPTPNAQNPGTGKSTRPTGTIFDLYDAEVWQSRFNKESSEIPANGFKAFYFEDSTASTRAYSDSVPFPALNYANSGPHGIPAGRFNAYWIGKFEFPENTTWRIDLSQSNSVARILIDKREIHSGNESRSLTHAFAKGDHLIEIEYKNNWHTITFSVLFAPVSGGTPPGNIDTAATGAEYWYAAAYESGNADLSLDVTLKKSVKPVVLFLSSYEVVRWNVLPADSSQVLAVFVDSHQPQSTVTGLGASVPVTTREGIPYAYKLLPDCEPQLGCDDLDFGDLVDFIGSEFKVSLTGYTGSYNPASMVIPEVILDPAKYKEIEERTRALIEGSK